MSEELTYINESEIQSSVERCLTFESGGLVMFLSTNFVIEIINDHSITPIPLVPPYIKGIINLRGQMLPIVDIRARMGKPQAEYTSKTCIVVLEVDSVPFGIIVDSVRQVMDIDLQDVRPIPVKRQEELLNGMVTLEDGSVLMSFDCRSLFVY
ncbi:MAG: chemotaxis protein CheW [Lachnospiraceae bacterium]|nr:chemotaxis protein CheW [Lachnospiraceae bacterium]